MRGQGFGEAWFGRLEKLAKCVADNLAILFYKDTFASTFTPFR